MRRLQGKQSGKTKGARSKTARVRRTLAIVLLVGGVLLETLANVVQLVESHTVTDVIAGLDHVPPRVERWLHDLKW